MPPGIPTQFDVKSSVDISALSSITKTQLIQMINRAAPLSNVGGVLMFIGSASSYPDINLNPRFSRYIWLDTATGIPVLKVKTGAGNTYNDWTAFPIANASIVNAMLTAYCVSAKTNIFANTVATDADKNKFLLVDGNGQYVGIYTLANALSAAGNVALANIQTSGASASANFIKFVGGALAFGGLSASDFQDNAIALAKITNQTPSYILRANRTTGVVESVSPSDATLFNNGSAGQLPLSALSISNFTNNDDIRSNGTIFTPVFRPLIAHGQMTGVIGMLDSSTYPVIDTKIEFTHNLGGIPKLISVRLKNVITQHGYDVDDEILLDQGVGADGRALYTVSADADKVYISIDNVLLPAIIPKAGGSQVTITAANWKLKVYAFN